MGLRIDLGCGRNKVEGCLGVDLHRHDGVDIVADVRHRTPGLDDGCAEFVVCRHVIEHLGDEDWRLVLHEIARLLAPGGTFEVRVPHPSCENAMINGHNFVMTPLYWQRLESGEITMGLPLAIDQVIEVPDERCIQFCQANSLEFREWSRFLFNAFYETEIVGHRC